MAKIVETLKVLVFNDGFPAKVFRYQAAGKPTICCAEGEPAKYVEETNSGIVVKPRDYEALAEAVIYLREHVDVAEKLGASARRYVEIGMKMMAVFSDVLRGSSRVCEAGNRVA